MSSYFARQILAPKLAHWSWAPGQAPTTYILMAWLCGQRHGIKAPRFEAPHTVPDQHLTHQCHTPRFPCVAGRGSGERPSPSFVILTSPFSNSPTPQPKAIAITLLASPINQVTSIELHVTLTPPVKNWQPWRGATMAIAGSCRQTDVHRIRPLARLDYSTPRLR